MEGRFLITPMAPCNLTTAAAAALSNIQHFARGDVWAGVLITHKKVSTRPGKGPNEEDNTGAGCSRVHVGLHTDPTPTRGQRVRPQWSHYMLSNDGGAC